MCDGHSHNHDQSETSEATSNELWQESDAPLNELNVSRRTLMGALGAVA